MGRLDEVTVEELQDALDDVERKKPTQRLLAAIAYKHGVSQTELAEWHGVQRKTIYNWLTRLETQPIDQAVRDGSRSGRPRKLASDQQDRVEETLAGSPADAGYDASAWTPELVRRYLRETFDVEYSRPSCRRLLNEVGVD
jgi:transposase